MRSFMSLVGRGSSDGFPFLRTLSEDARVSSFAQWFAGSQCVNDDGSPKRMFHGTGRGDIRAFDPAKADPNGLYGPGFYFTDSHDVAGSPGKLALDPADPWQAIDASARFQQAGYAFQRPEFDTAPLTKRQMYYASRLLDSNAYIDMARSDMGTRRNRDAGWAAWEEGPEAFGRWLAKDAPDWLVAKLKVEKRRLNSPAVLPVYLSIKNPFEAERNFTDAEIMSLAGVCVMDEEARQAMLGRIAPDLQRDRLQGVWLYKHLVKANLEGRYDNASNEGEAKRATNLGLRRAGYDGIRHDGGQIVATFGGHDVWIAFEPNQIKSVYACSHTDSPNIDESAQKKRLTDRSPSIG